MKVQIQSKLHQILIKILQQQKYEPDFIEEIEFFHKHNEEYHAYKKVPDGELMMSGKYPNHMPTGVDILVSEVLEYTIENGI